MAKRRGWKDAVAFAAALAVLLAFVAVALGPLAWMLSTSFRSEEAITESLWSIPVRPYLGNYESVLGLRSGAGLGTFYLNSVVVTIVSVAAAVAAGAAAAYGLSRLRLPGARAVYYGFLLGMMIPVHVTLIALLELFGFVGLHVWLDARIALIVTYAAFSLPVTVFILYGFFAEVPREIEEAARIDGAGPWQVFIHVMLPLARPALAVVTIFAFVGVWNEYVFAMTLVDNPREMTLPVGLLHLVTSEFGTRIGELAAAMSLAVAPLVVVYVVFQRQIVRGLMRGAVKG